jgi:hypothetical protein
MMTDSELDRLERLADEATPGPWMPDLHPLTAIHSSGGQDIGDLRADADLAFVAAARDAVPALVGEVRRLRARSVGTAAAPNGTPPRGRTALLSALPRDCLLRLIDIQHDAWELMGFLERQAGVLTGACLQRLHDRLTAVSNYVRRELYEAREDARLNKP